MRIKRVIIRNLKALRAQDDSFELGLNQGPSSAVCLRGVNGSGKTTYLETIAAMWEGFRLWSKRSPALRKTPRNIWRGAHLVAIQVTELPGPASSVWLLSGRRQQSNGSGGEYFFEVSTQVRFQHSILHRDEVIDVLSPHPADPELAGYWEDRLSHLHLAALSEKQPETVPNMVYLGAEERYIAPLDLDMNEDLSEPAPEEPFRWLARYRPMRHKRNHIENSITALRLVSPTRFAEIRERIHAVLAGVELLDKADPRTMRPLVRVAGGAVTTLDGLSAGERAALIALFHIARWLTPGGVVLIDEPELHQHISLMRINLAVLEDYVVREMKGQLIVASHSAEVWEHFRHTKVLLDLGSSTRVSSAES